MMTRGSNQAYNGRRQFIKSGICFTAGSVITLAGFGKVLPQLFPSGKPGLVNELRSLRYATHWINSPALTADNLKGRIVLIDFCTYSCINWLRTVPYTQRWISKYGKKGLTVIGIHTPEFEFEKLFSNVKSNVAALGIEYPIAMDNNRIVWESFGNNYWPARYILDGSGNIRSVYIGEGKYDETEKMIHELLNDKEGVDQIDNSKVIGKGVHLQPDVEHLESPEEYLGAHRTSNFHSPEPLKTNVRRTYSSPSVLEKNQWSLWGDWKFNNEYITNFKPGDSIQIAFHSRDVHIVMGSGGKADIPFTVRIDGKAPLSSRGTDINDLGKGLLNGHRLYQIVRQDKFIRDSILEISFSDKGAELFSITFG